MSGLGFRSLQKNHCLFPLLATAILCVLGTEFAAAQSLSKSAVNFGNAVENVPSAVQAVTLNNNGPAAVTVQPISVTGAVYTVAPSTTCPTTTSTTLAKNASCTIGLILTPAGLGAQAAGMLSVTTSASVTPLTATLTGTGVTPTTVSATSVNFGNVVVTETGATHTVTVKNNQLVPLNFSLLPSVTGTEFAIIAPTSPAIPCGSTLAAGATCTIAMTLKPPAAPGGLGSQTSTLSFTTDAGGAVSIPLSGTGVEPTMVSATSVNFGNVVVTETGATHTVTVKNNQLITLNFTSLPSVTGTEFAIIAPTSPAIACTASLAAGATCTIAMTLKPPAAPGGVGAQSSTLSFTTDAGGAVSIPLSGTGVEPTTVSATTVNFGNVVVTETGATHTVTVKNNQLVPLSFSLLPSVTGTEFAIIAPTSPAIACTASLAAGATCTIAMTLKPPAAPGGLGSQTSTLSFTTDAGGAVSIPLSGTGVEPTTVSATSVNFGNVVVTETGATHTVTVKNNQLVPLNFTSLPAVTGTEFAIIAPTSPAIACTASLAAGATCTIAMTLKPPAAPGGLGSQTSTLSFTTDAGGAVSIPLSGTGVEPTTVSATSVNFGNVVVTETGATHTVTVKNNQLIPLSFSLLPSVTGTEFAIIAPTSPAIACTASLAAGATCTIAMTLKPPAAPGGLGSQTSTLSFTTDAGGAVSIPLSGTGVEPTTVSATAVNFGNVVVTETGATHTVTVKNNQLIPLNFSLLPAVTGTEFAIIAPTSPAIACTASLAAGATCTIAMTLKPSAAPGGVGAQSSTLSFTTDAGGAVSIPLSGTGVEPTTVSATALNFGNVVVQETSATHNVTVKNNQLVALNFTSTPSVTGSEFAIIAPTSPAIPCVSGTPLAPGATCTIPLTLTPPAAPGGLGSQTSTLTIISDAGGAQMVALSGTGIQPVTLSTTALSFPATLVGNTSTALTVKVTNAQAKVLHFTPFPIIGTNPGDFAWTSTGATPCGSSIAAGASCVVSVTFTPQISGPRSATLQITDDSSSSPHLVTLSGNGNATLNVTPMSITNFSTSVGTTSHSTTVTIKNNNTSPTDSVVISSFQTTGDFLTTPVSCSPLPFTLAAGASCTVGVQFAPTIGGTRTGQLQVNDSALTSPQVVNLSGNGINPLTVATNPVAIKPPNLIYPAQPAGTVSTPKSITLANFESQSETFTVQLTGDFTLAGNSCSSGTINAHSTCIIAIDFAPAASATNGPDNGTLTINNSAPGGSALTVSLTGSVGMPEALVSEVTPGAGAAGTNVPVVILGNGYTHFSASSAITFVDTDSATYPADITVDAAAITGYSGSSGVLTLTATNDFTAGEAITIVAKSTDKLYPLNGQVFNVSATGLSGTQFEIPESAVTGSGSSSATATSQVWKSANEIDATLVLAASTSTNFSYGARNITVKTGTESAFLNSAFTIYDPTNTHTITMVNPNVGTQGQTLNVGLTATGTLWEQGVTFFNFGTGITINSTQITDATDAVVNISISNTTTVGTRTIVGMTGGEYASSAAGAFTVNPDSATLVSVSPNTEAQGWSGQLALTATGTHFLDSATTVTIGGGVIVGAVNVSDATDATVQVAVPANATIGPQNVTVATGGEIATLSNGFTVTGATPGLVSVVPSSGQQGQSLTVTVTGNSYTDFTACGGVLTADFTGVISSPTVTVNPSNHHQVTIPIMIESVAPVGGITARLTCGGAGSATIFPFGFTVTPSNASIVSVTPGCVPQGGQVTLALVGSNTIWNQAQTMAAFYPEPVATPIVNEIQVQTTTNATLNITVPTGTPVGNYGFYLATGGQVVSASMCVYANTPSMTMSPANGLVPSAGVTNYSVTFSGQFTNWQQGNSNANLNTQTPVIAGEGVTISASTFTVTSPVSATATVSVAAGAATTSRLVTVTTGDQILTTYFNVTSTPVGIISINPSHTPQGVTTPVSIVGLNTHFCDNVTTACPAGVTPTTVLFGPEITVVPGSISVADNTHLTVSITTSFTFNSSSTLTTPGYQTVYVNTGNEMVTGAEQVLGSFSVDPPASPTLVSVVPSSAPQGSTESVTITGSLTNWCSFGPTCPNPTEAILGAGVTVADLVVTSPTTATATISVSPTAPIGGNSVTMITGSQIVGGTGFSVTPSAAYIASVEPNFTCPEQSANYIAAICGNGGGSPTGVPIVGQLQTLTLNIVGVGTHWLQGGTTFSFGTGVVVDSLTINSPTTATVQITVLSSSPIGFATATAYTDGEVASLQQAIDIESGFPVLLAISPGGGEQGASMNLQVLGRFTHWDSTTNVAFNQDITVNSVTIIDSQNLIANITVSPLAYVDFTVPCGHVLTITTPDANEQVSTAPIQDNYCVSQGAEEITGITGQSSNQGSTLTVNITGSATNFVQGETAVSFGDPNLQVGQITVNSPTSLTAAIAVSTAATPGFKTVTVTTLGQVASQQYSFTVYPTVAHLTEANPYQAEQGQQLYLTPAAAGIDVILTGQYTHFSSASTATFGPGIVVNTVTWQSATQVTANITIDPLSYTGGRTVTVTTPNVSCANQPPADENVAGVVYQGCTPGSPNGTGSEIVSANAFTIIAGPAIISNVAPNTGNEGQEVVFNLTGTDTHWQQNFTQFYIAGGGYDLTINSVIVNSPTSATVDMTISPTANPGARSIYMQTAGESLTDSGAFVVTGGIPAVAYISPNNGVQGNTTPIEFKIHGIYTLWAPGSTTINFGPGITASNVQIDDNFNIEGTLAIANNATPGYHIFTVTTTGLPSGTQVLSGNFLVTAAPGNAGYQPPPAPYIAYFAPSSGLAGQTFNISFAGQYTKWDPNPTTGTQCSFGSGIQVNSCQVLSQTSILANITILPATPPQTNLVVFTTGTETESVDFRVVQAVPTLTIVDPGSGMQGDTNLTVNILGQYTLFDNTTTFNFGSGVTVNSVQILGPTIATATISIDQLATLGGRGVVATTSDTPGGPQVVGGAYFSVTPSLAQIVSVTPNTAEQGQSVSVLVTGSNTHWNGSTVFSFGDGITVSNTNVTGITSATLTLNIPALAAEGPTYVSAQTLGEIANLNNAFVVTAGTPYLLSSGPGSLPQQSSATFTILSQATNWTQACASVSYGAGVVISNVQVTGPTSLTVLGAVQATTPVGYRNLTVTCGSQVLSLGNAFYVSPGPAVINSVTPNTGGQGVNLPSVQIEGTNTNWVNGVTTLTFPGVLVNSFMVTSPTTITANITPSDYAQAGEVSVTATTQGEVATGVNVFDITQTQPELLAVVPTSAPQAWTSQTVTLTADFTHFCDNVTTNCPAGFTPSVANFGTGITVNSVSATSLTKLVATVSVLPTANTGYRNVSVITGNESVEINNAFNVTLGPAAIASLNPETGGQNTTATITVTGSQTHFNSNAATGPVTTASFGGGIIVTGITVTDSLHANVNITIPSGVALGNYNVTLTTGGEVATILGDFQVTSGNAVITNVNPPTGTQGISENVSLIGLYTHFCDNVTTSCTAGYTPSVVTFGSGITVNTVSATNSTTVVASITISTTATIGSYTPTVTTGPEGASKTGGFSVLAGVPALTTVNPSMGQAGTTANVIINGVFTTFQAAFSQVSFGSGITVNFISSVTTTQLTANITIASNATVGNRTVSVDTNGQNVSLNNAFAVTAGTPEITQINPNYGNPGQTSLSITLTGLYTNWSTSTTVTMGTASSLISVGGQPAGSPGPVTSATATSVTFTISIPSNAPLGPVEVTTTTGAEVEIVPGGFTVQAASIPAPSVALISPGLNVGGNVPINSSIIAVFSQPMMRSTIIPANITLQEDNTNGQTGNPYISGTVTLDASGRVMTFTPNSLLPVNSQFYLYMSNSIQDATGRPFPAYGQYLYTSFAADSTAPTVVLANPPANDTGIGTNVAIQLQFSVPMSQGTETGLTVSSGGGPVTGTYLWNSDPGNTSYGPGNILTFTPSSPLSPNTVYTVTYSSTMTDTAGNALTPGSFSFTTGPVADTANNGVGPDFTSGVGNVGTNFAPRMNFVKPVNPIDINPNTLGLYNYDSGKYLPGAVTVAPNGMSAVFTPLALLLPGTRYEFYQNGGYYDADGNYLNGNTFYFTTGNGKDQTAPSVQSISPPDNATGVPLNGQLTVVFSAPIDPETIGSAVTVTPSGGSPIPGTCSLASDQVTMTCVATEYLLPGKIYSVQISGYQDMVGNAGTSASASFTTAGTAGGFAPIVLSTGLNASGNLIAQGNTADGHWVVTPTSGEAIGLTQATGSTTPPATGPAQPLLVVTSGDTGFYSGWPANGPASDWININPNSTTNNTYGVYSTAFTMPNPVPAGLCLVGQMGADDNGKLAIDGTVITGSSYISAISSLASLSIPVSSYLTPGANTLSLVWGSTDNSYEAFRLQAVIAPCSQLDGSSGSTNLTLTSSTPSNGQSSVSTATSVTLTFNNVLNPTSVNSSTLQFAISGSTNQEIAGAYQVTGNQVVFTPDSPLPTSTQFYVYACNGPQDLAGDSAGGCNTTLFTFTTGSTVTPASTLFQVVAFTPAANSTSVGLRAPVAATFNRSLDLNTINGNDFALFQGDGQSPWCSGGSYQHSQDDTTILFNCGIMPSSTVMTAQLSSGLTDWQGNGLVPYSSSFTTTYYDSNTHGSIVSSRPGTGASGVANNVSLVLYSNLPINPSSVSAGLQVAENGTPLAGATQVVDNGYTLIFTPSATPVAGALIQWWTTGSLTDTLYNLSINGTSGYFYVAANTGALAPTVQTLVPTAYTSGVPLNAFVDLQFNTPLNAATITSSNIYLSAPETGCGGAITPVTYTSGLPANEVRMVPNSPLAAGDFYYVCVESGLQSATSVPATNYQPYFYAGTAADSTLPMVLSAVPFNGATNVGVNVAPGVVFNKAIDPLSVNSTTFTVSNGGSPLAGSYWFSSNDTRIEFVPNAALPVGTELTMTLNGVLDPVGHSVNYTSSFTTGSGPDVTSPSVIWSSATSGGSIPANAAIAVQFSESMDVTTFSTCATTSCSSNFYLYDTLLGQDVPATLSWNSNQTIAYLVPSSPLAAGRTYYFYVTGGTDLAGNSMSPNISWTIYADLQAPPATTVVAINPTSGSTGVGTNTFVEAEFSAPIDPTTMSGVTLKNGSTPVAVTAVLSAGNTVLQLVPPAPLAASASYTITVAGVKDTTGNTVATHTSTFSTGSTFDIAPLTVVTAQPANNSTVATNVTPQLRFNKPLNPITVNTGTFRMETSNPGVYIPINVTLSADRTTVTLTPVVPLQPGTEYQFSGGWNNGPQDQDGNYLNLSWYYFYTSGASNTTSSAVTINPANGATGIPLNAQVIAFIGTQIDPTTVGQNAIQLTTSGNPVAGTVNVVNTQEISFTPAINLVAGDVYTVNVGNFTDVNGNAVSASATTFTAGTAASTPGLTLIQSDDVPGYGATGVSASTSTTITLQFSQILDPATVNTNTMPVMVGWQSNQALPGSWAVNGNQATFTPSVPYPYGATIYVGACGGPTDVLGEVFQSGNCWTQYLDYFTVVSGAGSQVGTFQVLSVSPAPGATNVLTNAPVSVTFSNSVAYSSWYNNSGNIQLYAGQGVQKNGSSINISSDGRTLTFNGGALYNGTDYTLTLPAGGITDDWGNKLASTYTSTFTTTSNPDFNVGAGSVTGTTPGNTSGIPTNSLLTLYLNRQVNASTLTGNLIVTMNGSVYPGTVTSAANGYEVQYTPTNPFPNSATVQWWFSNAEDVSGVTINSDSGYFYIAPPTPIVNPSAAPTIVALSPPNQDGTNVPTNAEFDVQFSSPIMASTVTTSNISSYLETLGGYLPGSDYTVSLPSPDVVRVRFNSGLSTVGNYTTICIGTGVTGTNSVSVVGNCNWTDYFYPTYGPDTSSGTVTIGPPNGSVNVGTNAYFRLNFSKPVDQTTFNSTNVAVTTGGNPVPGSWTYSKPSGNLMGASFYPTNPLTPNTTYKVAVSGLLDYAGNTFNSATSTFTTGPMPEYNAPAVTLDFPGGTTGIATNASFTCHYSEAMDPSSFTSSGLFVWSYVANAAVPATITVSADMMSATITPTTPLYGNTQYYYACYYALDLTGNAQGNVNASFYTGSGTGSTGPALVYANPPSGSTNVPLNTNQGPWNSTSLDLLFSQPIANQSLASLTLTSQQQQPTVGPTVSVPIAAYEQDGNYIVSVDLGEALLPDTLYTFNLAGLTNQNGNPLSGTSTTSFTTVSGFDSTTPSVASTVPVNSATNVSVTGPFSITFNEEMNPTLITPGGFYLRTHNTQVTVPATVSISNNYQTITITPTAPLTPSTIYDLLVSSSPFTLYDIAGNGFSFGGYVSYSSGYVFSTFTTGTASAINGACGSANSGTFAMAPNTNLCSAGTASSVTNPGSWSWTCNGQFGGTNASCSATVTSATCDPWPSSSLVSWWPGDDNINDIVGGNNGTLENGAGFGLGEVGDAFSFNGNNEYVLIGQPVPANLQIQNAITLSAWVYPTAYPTTNGTPSGSQTWGQIMGSEDGTNHAGAAIFFNGYQNVITGVPIGAIDFDLGDGSAFHSVYTTTQVPLNQWTLVTATATANNPMQIYFNGVAQPTVNNGTTQWTGPVSYNGDWFAIGQNNISNWPFNGLIDEAQVYSSALTALQIQSVYSAGYAGVCTAKPSAMNGVCGSSNSGSFATPPATSLCSVGTASYVTDPGSWTWSCPGSFGGTNASCSATNTGSVCAVQPGGLIDWWPANGNTNDTIGGNNGAINGTVTYAAGEVGQAFSMSGSGSVGISMPSLNTANGQITVSFWMKWNGTNNVMPLGFTSYDLYLYNGAFGFNTTSSDIWGISSSGLANQWVQVTAVFTNGDPHSNQLYINGVQQTLTQQAGTTPHSALVTSTAKIGGWNNNNSYEFTGLIDAVQVYNGALTAAQAQAIYNAGTVGVCQ
jgi:hypothetical protein